MADLAKDTYAELESQIAGLKAELAALSREAKAQAGEAAQEASEKLSGLQAGLRGRAAEGMRHVRDQAHVVQQAARENPGTAATVGTSIGVIGFLAGALAGGIIAANWRR